MTILVVLLLLLLVPGQLGGLMIAPGVTVYLHDVVVSVLVVWYMVRQLVVKKQIVWGFLGAPIGGFLFVGLLSLLVNSSAFSVPNILVGSLYLVRWGVYALLYVVVLGSSLDPAFWFWGLYLAGTAVAVLGLIQYVWYPYLRNLYYLGWDPHYLRVFSTFLDPNFVGLFLLLTMLLGVYLWIVSLKERRILILTEGVNGIAFLLTFSRSSYLALLFAVFVLFGGPRQWKFMLLFIVLFVGVLFLLPKTGEGQRLDRMVSTVARLGNWQQSLVRFTEAPILGHGFNTLRFIQTSGESIIPSRAAAGVDNSILFIAITTGLMGIGAYGWILFRLVAMARILLRKKTALGLIYLASLIAIAVHAQFNNSLFYPWILLWVWIVSGVISKVIDMSHGAGPLSYSRRGQSR